MPSKELKELMDRVYKTATRSVGKNGETIMHIGETVHPSPRLKYHWGQQAKKAKAERLAKWSRENPPLDLKPKKK